MKIRVLLVEDHRLVREALRDALARTPEIEVAGEAGDAHTALELAKSLRPDVVVLDICLPDLSGIEIAARLMQAGNAAKIVALSAHSDKRFVVEMMRAGATAYISKSAAGTELVRAILAVAAGQNYLCPEVAGALVSEVRGDTKLGSTQRLGRREREVLRLVAEGQRSLAIADKLNIEVGTVEVHRRNIKRKLGLHTVAELTRYAIREGIISD
ncbi:DNA-binding response regulator [Paucibacter sp. KBW04]|uniref:response regulator n=1 Tax=Paucibacter sp. KBW04 TaxID=2153361 RepID=UPI000F566E5F|nr:response regulator transcription factor [Paucibacter sp. KBW04]RQO58014.1 DNA-binding response regulator [Paucibacter sp. KBW04]